MSKSEVNEPKQESDLLFSDADLFDILRSNKQIFVKKLSNNDRDWANYPNKHQQGVYIPAGLRDSGFFPPLQKKVRSDPNAKVILEAFFTTTWPQFGEVQTSRLVHYTSKTSETHLTGVPKSAFESLAPASYFVMVQRDAGRDRYDCFTVESGSDSANFLEEALRLEADFHAEIRNPEFYREQEQSLLWSFADELVFAWLNGTFEEFSSLHNSIPSTVELAKLAQEEFLRQNRLATLDPFSLSNPGDAIRKISRDLELDIFKRFQLRERSIELVKTIVGGKQAKNPVEEIVRNIALKFNRIDKVLLSASQQRKSRAGYSFEHHIERLLLDGNVPFEKQVILEMKRRPDFILPSFANLKKREVGGKDGLILSAKTTLRERWKQVQVEMVEGDLFLATVDENIAASKIQEMATMGITLVVPEGLKDSKETEYVRHDNVISFKTFFEDELAGKRLPGWLN